MWFYLFLFLFLSVVQHSCEEAFGFPNGAPASTCINNLPKHHGAQQQSSLSPYRLDVTPSTYSPGSTITVTVTSAQGTRDFIGFQVRAQAQSGDTESLVGTFPENNLPPNALGLVWWPSTASVKIKRQPNCVTHKDNSNMKSISLQWMAPSKDIGPIVFSAGIVENFETFWVSSNRVILPGGNPNFTPPVYPSQVGTVFSPDLRLDDECGRIKGCMLYPIGCHGNDCRFAVSYKPSVLGTKIDFEVMGYSPGYLSLAFSEDTAMGKDLTTTCVHSEGRFSVQNGYNPKLYNERHPIQGLTNIQVQRIGDRIFCRFSRPFDAYAIAQSQTGISRVDFSLSKEWYLFLAYGEVYDLTDVPNKHDALPLISQWKVDLTQLKVVGARTLYPVLQAHGSLGIISWIALVSMAIFIARFYRQTLDRKVAGAAIWFQAHRALAISAVVLSYIGVIEMFAYQQRWSQYATVHAVFGLVALTFATVQIVGGILRPHPGTERRTIFNWIHRSSGLLGFICAVVCVLLAFQISLIGEPLRFWGSVTVAVWLGFILVWFSVLQLIYCMKQCKTNMVETVTHNGLSIQDSPEKPHTDTWRVFHIVWLVVGGIMTVTLTVLMLFFINVA